MVLCAQLYILKKVQRNCFTEGWKSNEMITTASVLAVLIFQIVIAEQLPADFKRCSSKDSACLKEAIQQALPKFAGGIKELGVPPLDPIRVPKLAIKAGGIVQLDQNYRNIEFSGLPQSKLNNVSFDLDKGKIIINFLMPATTFQGSYVVKGKILVLDVYGQGKFTIKHKNTDSKLSVDVQKYDKNGETYLKVTRAKLEGEPERVFFQYDNLFDGNKQLGDVINEVLNDNWKEIYEELKDDYINAISMNLMILSNKLFEKIPLKYIFLD